ncbi:hypothetical protein Aca07nite_49900 [Actinoplanes capillaceus]|uniref:Lumazine-binding n=1 Tax=Actinoplanes campanulatus TaxID=113559 RepID=A0ABQ3WNF9_9ACTN|nr:hypothetical protein [Actinoplanes capillaceus]GID47715.1 hypothetical protein Aca07nite_49900 [Actinoplanes capillaceus]
MQPSEPGTGDVAVTPPERPRARLQSRRARLWLAMGGGIMALLCLGGVGAVFLLFNENTEIKRSAPDAVVDNFLGAYFVSRNDKEVALYRCEGQGNFAALDAYRAQILAVEQEKGGSISVSWSTFTVSAGDKQGIVTTDLIEAGSVGNGSLSFPWSFEVVNQDGWRVCGASKLG